MKPTLRSIVAMIVAVAALMASASDFADETLRYKVLYKWGLINKTAGYATISLRTHGDRYHATLVGASAPWADRIFMVRDTLNGVILRDGLKPVRYEKIAHEGKDHKHDVVKFSYQNNGLVIGDCYRRKTDKTGTTTEKTLQLEAMGTTVDMLSSFYYMRRLPFDKWQPGHGESINIFSGKQKELLKFAYRGIEEVKVEDQTYRCYRVTFIFTSDGKKKTSDDMDAWITADDRRMPVKLEGKLPVGKVHCLLISAK